ncbi:2-dehydropantoate 2-reductase [Saliniradius amylolyticus]|uniref:2-dehydropantoate 2-reductase n=1 Tax=Saliniradius amylolyticus TaxID=2183582 RepID=A0A2S2E3F8_9ALTE|nr:2-dehydropantoate 2-reductase [Saliniradius amylolyticus]AWL12185.1 2-dehydropantoate 2-reductase [Saliniradius amylolyticus]
MTQRHLVAGAGLIGGYIGGALQAAGAHVRFLGRPEKVGLWHDGLTLSDYQGHKARLEPQCVTLDEMEPVDIIWVTVKCHAVDSMARQLASALKSTTCIYCCQNGLGAEQSVRSLYPDIKVLRAMVPFNVVGQSQAHLHRGSQGELTLEMDGSGISQSVFKRFQSPLLPISLTEDIDVTLAAKLQLNLSNAVNALVDLPVKAMLQQRGYRCVIADLMEEWLRVVKASGRPLPKLTTLPATWLPALLRTPDWLFSRLAQSMLAMDDSVRTSMWWDIHNGKQTEVDYLNGAVVEQGRRLGIATPLNQAIVKLIHQLEKGEIRAGWQASQLSKVLRMPEG